MAVVYVREVYKGVGLKVQGTLRDWEGSVTRKFIVRVDNFFTSGAAICAAPGISMGMPHPALPTWTARDFSVDCEDGNGLMWGVSVTYKAGRKLKQNGLPEDDWSVSASTSMVPAVSYYPDPSSGDMKPIENSAGAPLEGLKAESSEFSYKLVRAFETAGELMSLVRATNNHTNADYWGGAPRTWKCDFKSGTRKKVENPERTSAGDTSNENAGADGEIKSKEYWEGVFEFRYDALTWDLQPWDAGYMQKVDSQGKPAASGTSLAAIRGKDGKPVKEPWKLDGHGVALPVDGTPVRGHFATYRTVDFNASFGTPPA